MRKKELPTKFDKDVYERICIRYMEKYNQPEEWRNVIIKGNVTKYKISNYGRIKNIKTNDSPSIYKNNGHFGVYITIKKNKYRYFGTYRLVAMAFIPIPKKYFDIGYEMEDLVVDHKRDSDDDNFLDNTVWNLQWLTHRENISKASNCGYRKPFTVEFKEKLDKMILDDYPNKLIYSICKDEFGFEKEEIKAMIQVRRRRLNKTIKEHHEHDKEYINKVDNLLRKGLSNSDIIKKLNMDTSTRTAERLLQYRRSILKIPSNQSKYFNNELNEKLKEMIISGLKNKEIISQLGIEISDDDMNKKVNATINSRRCQYKKNIASSTTIENIT